tara:strand:+ start:323 stop:1897 length:1575 start_codon:yes stop_codon:yes gene_type:complete
MPKNINNQINEFFQIATYNLKIGNYQNAKKYFEIILNIDSKNVFALYNLGIVFQELGEFEKAIELYEKVLRFKPKNVEDVYLGLGIVFKTIGDYKKSLESYENAIRTNPEYVVAYNNLGNLNKQLGFYEKALDCFHKAIKIKPKYATAHNNLGTTFRDLGKKSEAKKSFETAISLDPNNLLYLYNLTFLDNKIVSYELKEKLKKIIKEKNISKKNIAYGCFILSRYEEKNNNHEQEISYLINGHKLFYEFEKRNYKKDINYWLDILPKKIADYNLENEALKISKDECDLVPIFIIGVPRSGSTLIEKIITSGKITISEGEETGIIDDTFWKIINYEASKKNDLFKLKKKIVDAYKVRNLINKKNNFLFTDKSLENFFYLDIIKKLFPRAKIINCQRNFLSTTMSTFQTNLPYLSWTHSIENILKYHDTYFKTINQFTQNSADFIYNLSYEKLIDNPEKETKDLFNYCELPWRSECLEFYKRKNLTSNTSSNLQIRNPINKDAKDKYFIYKKFLIEYGKEYSWFK